MADNQLIITLVLDDKASKEAAAALQGIGKASEDVGEKSKKAGEDGEKATTKHKDALIKARDAVKQFHKEMFVLALALGAATAATNEWSSRNDDARKSVDNITLAFKNGLAALGKFIQPMVDWVGNLAGKFNQAFGEELNDNLAKASIAIKNFDTDLKKINDEFLIGQLNIEQYYNAILEKQDSVIGRNRMLSNSLQEFAQLQTLADNPELRNTQKELDERSALVRYAIDNEKKAYAGLAAFRLHLSESINQNLSTALTSLITGAQTAKQAFTQLGQAMIQSIVGYLAEQVVAFILQKTLLAGLVGTTLGAAGTIAAGWGPAAFLATVATLGAAAAQAPGALAAGGAASAGVLAGLNAVFSGVNAGGNGSRGTVRLSDSSGETSFTKTFHDGGIIKAHNGLAVDEVPIIAQTGEGVLSRKGMSTLGGNSALNMLNSGKSLLSQGGGDIYIYLNDIVINSKENIKELAEDLGFEIDRKLRNARSFV